MKKKKTKYKFEVGDIVKSDTATSYVPLMITGMLLDEQTNTEYYVVRRVDGQELDFPAWPVEVAEYGWSKLA